MMAMDRGKQIELDRRFPHVVTLPRHPDHPYGQKHGDPRKAWLYSGVASGSWRVDEAWGYEGRMNLSQSVTYRFAHDYDAIMFKLKWS